MKNKAIKVVMFRFMVMLLLITGVGGQSNTDSLRASARGGDSTAFAAGVDTSSPPQATNQVSKSSALSPSDKLKTAKEERAEGNAYPSTTIPPLALDHALAQVAQHIQPGIPQGSPSTTASSNSTLSSAWTSLGPQPLNDGVGPDARYGKVAGRINTLAVRPGNNAVAYAGADGGGIWRTTNCCSEKTTWQPISDDPYLTTAVIGTIAIDPTNPNNIYAGTGDSQTAGYGNWTDNISMHSRGVLRSSDGGLSWITLGAGVFGGGSDGQPTRIIKMVVNPSEPGWLLAGTDSGNPAKAGIYASRDGGNTWTHCLVDNGSGDGKQVVSDLTIDTSSTPARLYVALGGEVGNVNNGVYSADMAALNGGSCPTNWHTLLVNVTGPSWGRIQLAQAPSDPNILYALIYNRVSIIASGVELYRSINHGATWTRQSDESVYQSCDGKLDPLDEVQTNYDLALSVDPSNDATVYVGLVNIYRSTNSGFSFTNLSNVYQSNCPNHGTIHPDQHQILTLLSPTSLHNPVLVANDGGVYASTNEGTSWTELNDSLSTIQFYAGDVSPNFATTPLGHAFGGAQDNGSDVYTTTSSPSTLWTDALVGDGSYTAIEPIVGANWYAEGIHGELYCSFSGADGPFLPCFGGWITFASNRLQSEATRASVPFVLDHHNCSITCQHMVLGTNRVWEMSPSGGTPWQAISGDLTTGTGNGAIRALSFAPQDTSVVYVGTTDGKVQYTTSAAPHGPTGWHDLTDHGPTGIPNRQISDIAVSPTSASSAYVTFDGFDENSPGHPGHLYQVVCLSVDCQGTNRVWTNRSGNLPNIPTYSVAVNPLRPNQVFVGTEIGMFYTDNISANPVVWQSFQVGMPVTPVFHLTIDNGNTSLVAWTFGRGAYATRLPQAPPTWQIVPTSTDGQLFGVAATSPNNAWAVGERYGVGNYAHTLTMHWDGSHWNTIPSPNPFSNSDNTLYAVATVPGTNHAWAVGNSNGNSGQAITLYWDGTSWNAIANPTGLARPELKGVTALAENNVWAVGDYQDTIPSRTLIMHWNGSTWSIVPSPNPAANFNYLRSVSAVSANDIWTVGQCTASCGGSNPAFTIHWNGTAWSIVPNPPLPLNYHLLYSVTAVSSNDVWAVGRWGDQYGDYTLSEHWDGSTWSIVSTPNPPGRFKFLNAVWAASSGDVWAVGQALDNTTASTLTMHWDGTSWSIVPSPNNSSGSTYLNAVGGSSGGDVWAVGYYADASGFHTFIIHTNG